MPLNLRFYKRFGRLRDLVYLKVSGDNWNERKKQKREVENNNK